MRLEDLSPLQGGRDEGTRFAFDKLFIDGNVAGFLQLAQVGAQVAVGHFQQIPQVGEIHCVIVLRVTRAAIIRRRTGWWMISFNSVIAHHLLRI